MESAHWLRKTTPPADQTSFLYLLPSEVQIWYSLDSTLHKTIQGRYLHDGKTMNNIMLLSCFYSNYYLHEETVQNGEY